MKFAEIRGIGFNGLGAELMATAILDYFQSRQPEVACCVAPISDFQKRARFGLRTKLSNRLMSRSGLVESFMPANLKELTGIVSQKQVDFVVDASGFAFTDQWGPSNCRTLASQLERWKNIRPDLKVVMLPQAFGPFDDPETRSQMQKALQNIDLVFARDTDSEKYILDLTDHPNRVHVAPDYSCVVSGEMPSAFKHTGPYGVISPNVRMTDMVDDQESGGYLRFLCTAVKETAARGIEPIFYSYRDNPGDAKLANQVNEELGTSYRRVSHFDGKHVKGIVRGAEFMIASRFHLAQSALDQSVPTIGTGWSHKYQHQFEFYQSSEFLHSTSDLEKLTQSIETFCDSDFRAQHIPKLAAAAARQKSETQEMWKCVDACLGLSHE